MTDRDETGGLLRGLYSARLRGDLNAMCGAFANDAVFQIAGAGHVSQSRADGVGKDGRAHRLVFAPRA
jgi:ketosteroid isomerase-like protein